MQRITIPPAAKPERPLQPVQYATWVLQMLVEYFTSIEEKNPDAAAIQFMRAHAGCTIVVPVMPMIERMAMERSIVKEVTRDPSAEAANRLASLHGLQRRDISKTFRKATGLGVAARRTTPQHCRHIRSTWRMRIRV
jgi:hypothetical protein